MPGKEGHGAVLFETNTDRGVAAVCIHAQTQRHTVIVFAFIECHLDACPEV